LVLLEPEPLTLRLARQSRPTKHNEYSLRERDLNRI
jgi:hypothetical protein